MIKVTIEGTTEDFPNDNCSNPKFIESMKESVKRRLQLRPEDVVEITIKKPSKVRPYCPHGVKEDESMYGNLTCLACSSSAGLGSDIWCTREPKRPY